MSSEEKLIQREPTYDIAYLTSWPLVVHYEIFDKRSGTKRQVTETIERLAFEAEHNMLIQALQASNKAIKLRHEIATSNNLRRIVTLGCRALHYTGHGMRGVLAFEDDNGCMHAIKQETLRKLFSAGGGAHGVQCVFVSACHSEDAANAFVAAGVKHVVAVNSSSQIADDTLIVFMNQFYLALLVGKTVQQSYDIALESVIAAPSEQIHNDNGKFMLLPLKSDHNEVIFENVPNGKYVDLSIKAAPNNLIAIPTYFRARNKELQKIVQVLNSRRLVTITGLPGIGKTTLANAAASYIWKRRKLLKGVYLIDFNSYEPETSSPSMRKTPRKTLVGTPSSSKAQYTRSLAQIIANEIGFGDLVTDTPSLVRQLGKKKYLFILDGVDAFIGNTNSSELCVSNVIGILLSRCENVKFIVTCDNGIDHVANAAEYMVKLNPLSPIDSARLFHNVAPRTLEPMEYGCRFPNDALRDLYGHDVLKLAAGNPRRIMESAQLLQKHKMHELPKIMRAKIANEEKEANMYNHHHHHVVSTPIRPIHTNSNGSSSSNDSSYVPMSFEGEGENTFESELNRYIKHESGRKFWRQFGQRNTISWDEFEIAISKRFTETTGAYERPLSARDLRAIKNRLIVLGSGRDQVNLLSFGKFWPFYNSMEECVEMTLSLWLMQEPKMIHGLLSRKIAESTLKHNEAGTFLLRFSENNPGCIAVAYVDKGKSILHILIRVSENGFTIFMNDGELTYPTLEELVKKCRPLKYLFPGVRKDDIWNQYSDDDDLPA